MIPSCLLWTCAKLSAVKGCQPRYALRGAIDYGHSQYNLFVPQDICKLQDSFSFHRNINMNNITKNIHMISYNLDIYNMII